ncbi:putative peptidylprolyl isomerase [Rosa chinensis]|uniref:peptidylprolyl isomerase n=2 Tax=Rosa chinensis TaxID=74649 RepID=A0A2P6P8T2_ROSCH|nr:putative peptidylprolyl isomerase [Rosa chinensis]
MELQELELEIELEQLEVEIQRLEREWQIEPEQVLEEAFVLAEQDDDEISEPNSEEERELEMELQELELEELEVELQRLEREWQIEPEQNGEDALFTNSPEMAYDASGSSPTISPNAPLQFGVELLSWTSVNDITKDGGIIKKVLKEGEEWERENPKDLDEVIVKFEAHLEDKTLVAKSDPVEFTVKEGYFCPALAKAVKTMKKAEKVLLTVKPQYGFGDKGKPASGDEGAVPPNATLHITLELVSWRTVSELTDDQKVIKKILKEGEGDERPNEGAFVTVKLIGKLQDGKEFLKKGHAGGEEPFAFKTDKEQVIEGLDRAVVTMKKGEIAVVIIAPEYGFGSSESQQELAVVPPNSTLYYEIELVSFVKDKESWDMNTLNKMEAAVKEGPVPSAGTDNPSAQVWRTPGD